MGFFKSLASIFTGQNQSDAAYMLHVRCRRCGEVISTRVDLRNALNPNDEGGYTSRKTLVGNQTCFQRIEVTLKFDQNRRLIDQEVIHGEIVSPEEDNQKVD